MSEKKESRSPGAGRCELTATSLVGGSRASVSVITTYTDAAGERNAWFCLALLSVVSLSPIMDGLQQHEEFCDGRPVQALLFGGKPIRTIWGGLELISRFEFEFRRFENGFFERFEFLVCSKFNHTQCGCKCVCAVACLCPHNSISNVVVSVTIDS